MDLSEIWTIDYQHNKEIKFNTLVMKGLDKEGLSGVGI